jgi:SulP family sulfate permease
MQEANRLKQNGGGLYLCNLKDSVCEFMRKSGLIDQIGEENIFDSKSEAIQAIFLKLQRETCRQCERRIFQECQSVPVVKKVA